MSTGLFRPYIMSAAGVLIDAPVAKEITTSGHFRYLLDGDLLPKLVDDCLVALQAVEFDTLAFIGNSGAVLAPILSYELQKELLMVRKSGGNDGSNSGMWVEGNLLAKRVVVVDDLICSGRTMGQMMHALRYVKNTRSDRLKIVGLLLHMDRVFDLTVPGGARTAPVLHLPKIDGYSFQRMIEAEFSYPHPTTGAKTPAGLEPMYDLDV
jgi:hypothetical protein